LQGAVGFAKEDSAGGEAVVVDGAFGRHIVRTGTVCHRSYVLPAQICGQIHKLRRGDKQLVAVRFKIAAPAAGATGCTGFLVL